MILNKKVGNTVILFDTEEQIASLLIAKEDSSDVVVESFDIAEIGDIIEFLSTSISNKK